MKNKVSIIIPCYWANQELIDLTNKCLAGLPSGLEVIVVDDGSPIKEEPCFGTLIRLPENQGYGSAVNAGLDAANGDFIVISNNDIIFIQPDWLDHLLKPLKEGAGISTIRTTEPDGWFTEDRYEENAKFGSLWAMTRAAYEALGSLDERFGKGYGEDLDYWHRARDAGIRIVKNHNGLAEHLGKATFKVIDPKDKSFNSFVFTYKEKWGDTHHIFLLDSHTIIGLNDWELKDLPEEERKYYQSKRELSLDELKELDGIR